MDHPAADGHGDAPLVLIVDDERDIADMLDSCFRLEGYRTLVAHDAGGALAAACRAPNVILLDVNLPDGDGFSVCREVREIVACPIIFLTARVEEADALSGFAAGGNWAAAGVTLAATVVLAGAGAAAYGLVRRRETAA